MTLQYVDHIYCNLFLCWIWHCRAPADVFAWPLLRPLQALNRLFNAARFPALLRDSLLDKGGNSSWNCLGMKEALSYCTEGIIKLPAA
jgi:hypothetical protein